MLKYMKKIRDPVHVLLGSGTFAMQQNPLARGYPDSGW